MSKICIVGSGNWGSAIATIVGETAQQYDIFNSRVEMYVYEERIAYKGIERNLSEVINEENENVKYLPGITLPKNIVAVTSLAEAAKNAKVIIWVVPHQFVERMLQEVANNCHKEALHVSLIKGGLNIKDGNIELLSEVIERKTRQNVAVLMGANLANEVAEGQFCAATLGVRKQWVGEVFQKLFNTKNFSVRYIEEVEAVELCGALKNVVALGAGFSDGNDFGNNTKAEVIRLGLVEMRKLIKYFYPNASSEAFFESCGVADLITTCFGGRNRKCAESFARTRREWSEIERELLNGQKLQGVGTCEEIVTILKKRGVERDYPFFMGIYDICFRGVDPKHLTNTIRGF